MKQFSCTLNKCFSHWKSSVITIMFVNFLLLKFFFLSLFLDWPVQSRYMHSHGLVSLLYLLILKRSLHSTTSTLLCCQNVNKHEIIMKFIHSFIHFVECTSDRLCVCVCELLNLCYHSWTVSSDITWAWSNNQSTCVSLTLNQWFISAELNFNKFSLTNGI